MRRTTGALLLITLILLAASLLIPTTQAERSKPTAAPEAKDVPFSESENLPTELRAGLVARPANVLAQGKDRIQASAAGQPSVLNPQSALSAAIMTTLGGRNSQFSEVSLLASWDGREDFAADRAHKVDDFSFTELEIDQSLTRTAISEHTFANGFNENVYYYGDSVGNFWVGTDTNPGLSITSSGGVDSLRQVNIPALVNTAASGGFTLLNPTAGDCIDDQVIVTGIAVNPVADLADFGACDTIGEVVYVSVLDTGGCAANAANQPIRTRIFEFAFTDGAGAGAATPAGARQILRTQFANSSIAVDDDGSLYFHLYDVTQFTNSAIFKATEIARNVTPACATNPRVNRVINLIPSPPTLNSWQGTPQNPIVIANGVRNTNYSGPSRSFGNIVNIATGPHNVVYAAMARSFVPTDDPATQATEGPFQSAPLLGATPSMVIAFSDARGQFDACSGGAFAVGGAIPVADGISDPVSGSIFQPGVNNFRVFALGNGPDLTATAASTLGVIATTLKVDMQIDYAIQSGITVDEEGTVFVISGALPAGIGRNPSPTVGEILAFADSLPADRRADFIDFRGDALPNPPASGGNVGDGDSDRFDHIFSMAPMDGLSGTPTGISGLSRGFLLYTNRTRNRNTGTLANLPNGTVQGDDTTTTGELAFEDFDEGHQVAGGDDQNTPFRGDDNDGAGNTVLAGALKGGFEFAFGGPVGTAACVWNSFFLNSNGNITFGAGDTDNTPTVEELRSGPPRIAPAWSDMNPAGRLTSPTSFPVQALGFANVNSFKVRWIDTPEFGSENCTSGASNTFSVTLSDDGVSIDENASQPLNPANPIGNNAVPFDLQEGPTDLRFLLEPTTGVIFGQNPRSSGTGNFNNSYSRMDLLGTLGRPVIAGYSLGGLTDTNPPGLCESDLSEAARAADSGTFGLIPGQPQISSIKEGLIGEGTEPTIYELFDSGSDVIIGSGGEITFAVPDFDLRFEGNDPTASTPAAQADLNKTDVGFYGVSCAPPPVPLIFIVVPDPFAATPTTNGITNAIGPVTLNFVGSGFFPNEVTTVCSGAATQRPGKTVTTAGTFTVDTDGDGIPDSTVDLTNVTVVNRNLVRGTLATIPGAPGTAFPFTASGGTGAGNFTTTFTAGDNNIFGPFTRLVSGFVATGTRAPVVQSINATSGDCSASQDLLLTGSSFQFSNGSTAQTVNRVFAVEQTNPSNEIDATSFTVLTNNLISARFDFGGGNSGRTFLIFASGPGGTSRNLTVLPAGAPPGSPLGNELGVQVTFSCQGTPVVLPDTFQFATSNVNGTEGCSATMVTVSRLNPGAGTVSVDYATSDGTAVQKSDYEIALGTLTFGPGETSKDIPILINEDSLVEGNESFTLTLSNASSGGIGAGVTTINIVDDDLVPGANPIDDAANFVCQQYHDFLNREPDPAGLAFWTNEILSCGADPICIDIKRQNVSAAFFLSTEFQETGFGVIRTQRVAFGHKSGEAALRFPYNQFMHDAQQVGRGVIVGQPGADALLEANKQAYATQIEESPAFTTRFPLAQTAAEYVAALFASADVVPTAGETAAAVTAFGAGGTAGRVAALRSVADSTSVRNAELNTAFVLMEYYGYLRRNPTDLPDVDDSGYQFWLNKLNSFGGNFQAAQMVKAFLDSAEYRHRFGP
ncbi:MAG TPA: Calx-beta domain-containing protein [Pyrinomonadaceae bacterium]|nr:Calx-beta domain-containing protein [Pyrinomonadaceae bacterium]